MRKPLAKQYRAKNWKAYNAGLKSRGALSIWLDKEVAGLAGDTGKRGRSPTYSDATIQFCLSLKCLFGLPLRQSMGLVKSLLKLSGGSRFQHDLSAPEAPGSGYPLSRQE